MKHKNVKTIDQQSYNNRSTMKKQLTHKWNKKMKHNNEKQHWNTAMTHSIERQESYNYENNNEPKEG